MLKDRYTLRFRTQADTDSRFVFPDKKHEDFWEEVDQHQLVQLKITYPRPVTLSPCDNAEPGSQVTTFVHGTSLPLSQGAAASHTPMY